MVLRPLHPGGRRRHRRLDPRKPGRGRRDGRPGHAETEKTPAAEAPPRERARGRSGSAGSRRPNSGPAPSPSSSPSPPASATLAPRDLNDGTRGYADSDRRHRSAFRPRRAPTSCTSPVLAGFELSYRFSPRLAVGLGADFFAALERGHDRPRGRRPSSETVSTKPSVRASRSRSWPASIPARGSTSAAASASTPSRPAIFSARKGADSWEQLKGSATATGLGGEAAFGGEWDVAPRTVLFIEAGFRMASFGGLTGRNVTRTPPARHQTEPGTLYFFHRTGRRRQRLSADLGPRQRSVGGRRRRCAAGQRSTYPGRPSGWASAISSELRGCAARPGRVRLTSG